MTEDGPPLTSDDVEAAASVGRLPALARQLVFDSSWASLDVLLRYTREAALPLGDLEETIRALLAAAAALPDARRAAVAEELHAAKHLAAVILLRRLDRDPLTGAERHALVLAAEILADLGELERAARAYERAGDEVRAAEAFGALGDLDRMEACLAREEERRRRRAWIAQALRDFELLAAAGERRAAIAAVAPLPENDFDAASALAAARELERRLCRGRAVTLRVAGQAVRFAALPAVLGRDPLSEITLRDPGVSRRHARLFASREQVLVEDAGSRAGTFLAGARVGVAVPLPPAGTLSLGVHCAVSFATRGEGLLALEGTFGIDRALRAVVGKVPVPLAAFSPELSGLSLSLFDDRCRLHRAPERPVRLGGALIGEGCDLAKGDRLDVELPEGLLRIEVE